MRKLLNPTNDGFIESLNTRIYVDKSGIIAELNAVIKTKDKFVCISRPRRFGKTMAADMISAYYCRAWDSHDLFAGSKIEAHPSFEEHLNKYNVIKINMHDFLGAVRDEADPVERMKKFVGLIKESILDEIKSEIPDAPISKSQTRNMFNFVLRDVVGYTGMQFVIIIDEWDCIFREFRESTKGQQEYLEFLGDLFKDETSFALAYMTGILPIKKYGSESALGAFDEFSAADPAQYGEFLGFTLEETKSVCESMNMPFEEISDWYNGYLAENVGRVFNPRSVVAACLRRNCRSYWTKTEKYESLREYILMNFDGLRDSIARLILGDREKINIDHFSNDMTTFTSKNDILVLLVHLGYLGYDSSTAEAFMPNKEIGMEFVTAMEDGGWEEIMGSIRNSQECLEATWRGDSKAVAGYVEAAHGEASHLAYNDENSLSCTITLAYYTARAYYTMVREFPTGKGYADLVFLPKPGHSDKPAIIVELKWDKTLNAAIRQIKETGYLNALKGYAGKALLVGINYRKRGKRHECTIEEVTIIKAL